jgi:hypothetical protein
MSFVPSLGSKQLAKSTRPSNFQNRKSNTINNTFLPAIPSSSPKNKLLNWMRLALNMIHGGATHDKNKATKAMAFFLDQILGCSYLLRVQYTTKIYL